MAAEKCLYCESPLSRKEREEGWCDSCGKRLPASFKPSERGPAGASRPAAVATPSDGAKALGWLALSGACFFILAVMGLVTGNPAILARLVAIPIVVVVSLVVRLVFAVLLGRR